MRRERGNRTGSIRNGGGAAFAVMALMAVASGAQAAPAQSAPQMIHDSDTIGHPSPQKAADAFIKAGDVSLQRGEIASAIAFYQRAASLEPKDPVPQIRLGEALARAGSLAEAYQTLSQTHAKGPQSASLEFDLGKLLLRMDRPREALVHLEAARRGGETPALLNDLGVADDRLGDHAKAQDDYRRGLELKPGDPALRNNLGLSLALSGAYPAALALLEPLADGPDATRAYRLNLALVYGLSGQDEKAARAAAKDLGETDNADNRRYYRLLRAMDDATRTRAVFGVAATQASATPATPPGW